MGRVAGQGCSNLSPAAIARLTATWADEYSRWQGRDLAARRDVSVWADGVYLPARMAAQAECIRVLIGATPEGKKERVCFQVGVRESALIAEGSDVFGEPKNADVLRGLP